MVGAYLHLLNANDSDERPERIKYRLLHFTHCCDAGVINKDHPLRQVRCNLSKLNFVPLFKAQMSGGIHPSEYARKYHRIQLSRKKRGALIGIHLSDSGLTSNHVSHLALQFFFFPPEEVFSGVEDIEQDDGNDHHSALVRPCTHANPMGHVETYIPSKTTKSFSLFISALVHPSDSSMTRYIHRIMMHV